MLKHRRAKEELRKPLKMEKMEGSGYCFPVRVWRGRCAAFGTTLRRGPHVISAARTEAGNVLPNQGTEDRCVRLKERKMSQERPDREAQQIKRKGPLGPDAVQHDHGKDAQDDRGNRNIPARAGFADGGFPDSVSLFARKIAQLRNGLTGPKELTRRPCRQWLAAPCRMLGNRRAASGAFSAACRSFLATQTADAGEKLPDSRPNSGDEPLPIDEITKQDGERDADEQARVVAVHGFEDVDRD